MNQWAPWSTDPDDPADTAMSYEEALAAARGTLVRDYNPNHEPAGSPKGGQFAPKGTSSMSMNPDPKGQGDFLFGDFMKPELAAKMEADIARAKAMPETYLIEGPQREAMREAIVEKLYNKDLDKRTQGREATIILGLPGAGKSTLANPLIAQGAIEIDPDIAKAEIPEFNGGIGANAVHEESSMITKKVLARAIVNGDNIVWPRIDGKDKLERDIKRLQENGYKVHVSIIDVSQETAIRSAIDRYEKTGRLVSPSTIAEYGNTPEETYQTAKSIAGVTVARYRREHGKGVEQVTEDMNPYHDPETGRFTTAGWFTGKTVIRRKGRKMGLREHKVFAEHIDDVPRVLKQNREATALRSDVVEVVGPIVQVGSDTRVHPPKLPNRGSKEDLARQEMQKRYEELEYKGD